jgi:hypothetical protein
MATATKLREKSDRFSSSFGLGTKPATPPPMAAWVAGRSPICSTPKRFDQPSNRSKSVRVSSNNRAANDGHSDKLENGSACSGNSAQAELAAAAEKRLLEESFEQLSSSQKSLLARQLGYDSFANLLAASKIVTLSDGSTWWLTADRFGAWTAWNCCAIGMSADVRVPDNTLASP